MPPTARPPDQFASLGDRVAAIRRGRFVGRLAELDLFRAVLLAPEPPFALLHLSGPGGIGKSALLREYGRTATELGRPLVHLDGRNFDPSPAGFLLALRQALDLELTPRFPLAPTTSC